jgi:hypothetical protein
MFKPIADTTIGGTDYGYRFPWFGGNYDVRGTATSASDLYMVVGDLTKEVCIDINNRLGISNPSGNPTTLDLYMQANVWGFNGTYVPFGVFGYTGFDQGCGLSDTNYTYYQVLLSR